MGRCHPGFGWTNMTRRLRTVAAIVGPTLVLMLITYLPSITSARPSKPVIQTEPLTGGPATEPTPSAQLSAPRTIMTSFADVSEPTHVVANGHWLLLTSQFTRRLVAVDTANDRTFDLTKTMNKRIGSTPYSFVAGGLARDTFLLGSNKDVALLEISLRNVHQSVEDLPIRAIRRGADWEYSIELNGGHWLSTSGFHSRWLASGKLVDGALIHGPSLRESLFPDVTSPMVAMMLHRSSVAVAPNKTRIAQAFRFSCRIQVISSDGVVERQIAAPVDVKLEYKLYLDDEDNQEKMSPHARMKYCYTDVTASNDSIFALFAGKPFKEHKENMSVGDQLHQFTWDGRQRALWKVESPAQNVAVSPDGTRLWVLSAGKADLDLIEYRIPHTEERLIGVPVRTGR